jgi:hypothetical protein
MALYRRAEGARRGYPEPLLNTAYILISELKRVGHRDWFTLPPVTKS